MPHNPDPIVDPEHSLITRAAGGDRDAVGRLVERYNGFVFGYAVKLARNIDDAQDITQEVFLKMLTVLPGIRHIERFHHWLHRVTYHTGLNWLRRRRQAAELPEEDEAPALPDGPLIERAEQLEQLAREVNRLSRKFRVVVKLFYFDGLPIEEITRILDVPAGTVKAQLSRARNVLRQRMGAMGTPL